MFSFCFLGAPDASLHLMNLHNAFLGEPTVDGNYIFTQTNICVFYFDAVIIFLTYLIL